MINAKSYSWMGWNCSTPFAVFIKKAIWKVVQLNRKNLRGEERND